MAAATGSAGTPGARRPAPATLEREASVPSGTGCLRVRGQGSRWRDLGRRRDQDGGGWPRRSGRRACTLRWPERGARGLSRRPRNGPASGRHARRQGWRGRRPHTGLARRRSPLGVLLRRRGGGRSASRPVARRNVDGRRGPRGTLGSHAWATGEGSERCDGHRRDDHPRARGGKTNPSGTPSRAGTGALRRRDPDGHRRRDPGSVPVRRRIQPMARYRCRARCRHDRATRDPRGVIWRTRRAPVLGVPGREEGPHVARHLDQPERCARETGGVDEVPAVRAACDAAARARVA
jgi:hypothetical protein